MNNSKDLQTSPVYTIVLEYVVYEPHCPSLHSVSYQTEEKRTTNASTQHQSLIEAYEKNDCAYCVREWINKPGYLESLSHLHRGIIM